MQPVLQIIERVGPSDANVLITGENGTGKGVVAQALHAASPARARPMVTINAGGVSEGVFESELFGHVKGAFTDAKQDRVGRFELADGGTLFLDEIANVPLSQQQKLLRVLETGEFERLGSSRTRKADVRLISATNADLDAEVGGRPLPAGPALPAEHHRDPPAAAARAARGHPAAGQALPRPPHAQRYRKAITGFDPAALQALHRSRVAGQRPRAGSRRRARRADGAGQRRSTSPTSACARPRTTVRRAARRHEPRGRRGLPDPEGDGALRQRQPRREGARA